MITLIHSLTRAVVNPDGAWLSELWVGSDKILFPQTILTNKASEQKVRGGMHVCLPNFGPGGESGLAQHGFGRTSLWSILQQTESSVTLQLEKTDSNYPGLLATLTYQLEDKSLAANLVLTNRGVDPLRVAPGFHPYFALGASETAVSINKSMYPLDTLAGTEFIVANTIELRTADQTITLNQENLSTWAIWTDQLGTYVCVEPTFGGNRFLEEEGPAELLAPGNTKQYAITIAW